MPWPPGGVYDQATMQPFANGGFPNPGPPSSGAFPSSPTGIHPRFNPGPGGMSGRGGPFESGRGHHHTPHQSGGLRGRHRPPFGGRDDSFVPHVGRARRRDDDHRAQVSSRMQPVEMGKWGGHIGKVSRPARDLSHSLPILSVLVHER